MLSADQCSNLAAHRSGSVAAEWRFGTEPADQVRCDLGNAAHAEQCHVAIHLILQQGKRALHARLASSHRREEERSADKHELCAQEAYWVCSRCQEALARRRQSSRPPAKAPRGWRIKHRLPRTLAWASRS